MNLSHVVITSVDRDDLDDGGAEHFAKTINAIRNNSNSLITIIGCGGDRDKKKDI